MNTCLRCEQPVELKALKWRWWELPVGAMVWVNERSGAVCTIDAAHSAAARCHYVKKAPLAAILDGLYTMVEELQ